MLPGIALEIRSKHEYKKMSDFIARLKHSSIAGIMGKPSDCRMLVDSETDINEHQLIRNYADAIFQSHR